MTGRMSSLADDRVMDRLLFGDNQFFGVNHMSEEKARAQPMRFQDLDAIMEVLDAAYDEGVRTFMCTTHERIGEVCDRVRANPDRYAGSRSTRACPTPTSTPTRSRSTACSARCAASCRSEASSTPRARHVAGAQGHRGHHDAADRRRDGHVRGGCEPR